MQNILSSIKKLFNKSEPASTQKEESAEQFAMVTDANGQQVLADKAYQDYLNSDAPNPSQASLNKVLKQTSFVRVLEGGMQGGEPLGKEFLFQTSDEKTLDKLRDSLQIEEGGNGHCMCHGEPTLELYSFYNERLAVIGLHHGESIRWDTWKDDAKLVDGRSILHWLADHGIDEPLKSWQEDQEQQDVVKQAWNRWITAMPECLKTLPKETWDKVFQDNDVTPLTDALAEAYPELPERLLVLYEWFGHGAGPWDGFQAYELVAEHLLLQYSCEELIAAIQNTIPNEEQMEGAGRLFASNEFQKHSEGKKVSALKSYSFGFTGMAIFAADREDRPAAIPVSLREMFLARYQSIEDREKRRIALSAFTD